MTEMDNALQYQIYEQLKMLNNSVQSISQKQERTPDYREFSQMMPLMQMQYAQSMTPASSNFTSPAAVTGGFASGMHNFLDAQAQGLYSGFGITPQMQQFIQSNVLQPAGSFAGSQYMHGKSLAGNLGAVMFTNPTLGMTGTQKQMYATSLAANTVLSGTSVAQGITTLGGGAAALYGLGTLAGGIGLGPLAAGAGVLWGASKLMTSPLLNTLTDGKLGGMDPRIFRPFQYIKEQIEEEKNVKNFLTENAYKFINIDALDGRSGTDLSLKSRAAWSDMIRNLDKDVFLKDEDIQPIVEGLIQGNVIENVGSLEEGAKYLRENIEFVKEAKIILGGTYEDIVNLMAEFKRAGVGTKNFDVLAAELKGYATIIGKDIETVAAYGLNVAQQRSLGTTTSAEDFFHSALRGTALVTDFFNTYKDTEAHQGVINYIRNFDDHNAVETQLHGTLMQVFRGEELGSTLGAAVLTPLGEGEFEVDQEKLDNLLKQMKSGNLDPRALGNIAVDNVRKWDDNSKINWEHNAENIFKSQEIEQQLSITDLLLESLSKDTGLDRTTAAQAFLGLDMPQAKLLEAMIEHYNDNLENGRDIKTRVDEIASTITDSAEAEKKKQDELLKNFVKSTEVLEHIYDYTAKPIMMFLEDLLDRKTRGKIDLDKYDPYKQKNDEIMGRNDPILMPSDEDVEDGGSRDSDQSKKTSVVLPSPEDSNRHGTLTPVSYNVIPDLSATVLTGTELVRSDIRPTSIDKVLNMKSGKDPFTDSMTETNKIADKAARVTEQHTDVLKTYLSALERSIANLEERVARSYSNSTLLASNPTVFEPGRFAHSTATLV